MSPFDEAVRALVPDVPRARQILEAAAAREEAISHLRSVTGMTYEQARRVGNPGLLDYLYQAAMRASAPSIGTLKAALGGRAPERDGS